MATARLYSINPAKVSPSALAKVKGQAKIVIDELYRDPRPRLASEINVETEKCLKTRQSTLRVTLYYIIVFKSKGWINTQEQSVSESDTPEVEETVSE
jgi:hypothetical protein